MLGVFYCSEKGQAVRRNGPAGLPRRMTPAGCREAGTKCCPHERGHYGHCTGWKRTSGIREQTSYFICTYRSSFQGGCGLFYSTHFYFIPRHITKEYMIFITGVPAIVRVRFFCALMHPPYRGRGPPLRS